MLETYLRWPFQRLFVDQVAQQMQRISPNAITLTSALLGAIGAGFLIYQHIEWGAICFLFSGYADVLDGSIARIRSSSSLTGTVLDLCLDRFVEFMMVLSLYFLGLDRAFACLLMLGAMYLCTASFFAVSLCTQALEAQLKSRNISSLGAVKKSFYYSPGLIERAETFVFFFAMIAFDQAFFALAYLYAGLVLLTTLVRLIQFVRVQKALFSSVDATPDPHK